MKIKISNTFLLVLALMIATNGIKLFTFVIFSCLLHEFAHFFAIKSRRLPVEQFSLTFVGGSLKCRALQKQDDLFLVFVYGIGIFTNFFLGYLCNFIAMHGFYSRNFFILSGINFILAFFNAIPIKILDGYFILNHTLLIFFKNAKNVLKFCNFISLTCNTLLILFGFYYLLHGNCWFLVVAIYLLIMSFKKSSQF